jgi:hypothetical protein
LFGDIHPFGLAKQDLDIEILTTLLSPGFTEIPERVGAIRHNSNGNPARLFAAASGNASDQGCEDDDEGRSKQTGHRPPAFRRVDGQFIKGVYKLPERREVASVKEEKHGKLMFVPDL